jgi:hypothetical protein
MVSVRSSFAIGFEIFVLRLFNFPNAVAEQFVPLHVNIKQPSLVAAVPPQIVKVQIPVAKPGAVKRLLPR